MRSLYRREGFEGLYYEISSTGYPIFSPEVQPVQGLEWESKQTRGTCARMIDSDELEARPGAGPDGLLDIQDDIGIAGSERELPELIYQDSDGNI